MDAFHPDQDEVKTLKAHYQKGGLGDMTIKAILNNTLQDLLAPIREKRSSITTLEVQDILQQGTIKARRVAQETMALVREAIGIQYY